MLYSESIYETRRRKTREVKVGSVGIGGSNPIRVQSMTTSDTRNVEATVEQILKLEQAGCELVRMTVQGMKEAESCEAIRSLLWQKGCHMPLVADIHFYPPAAMRAIEFVDKVRINPGNFADKRALFIKKSYTDESYQEEVYKIEEVFSPLVLKAKKLGKAIRIGTNHGSLSDRIMNRYGDTALGMVESALEFARVCRKYDYHDLIFSMKASNPLVMVEAYRLLCARMLDLGLDYPLHLGVTEAGEGQDGRVKSALGMGTLLLDGIGDTIRVSLTEDPWSEIDPCKRLVSLAAGQIGKGIAPFQETFRKMSGNETSFKPKDPSLPPGGGFVISVSQEELLDPDLFSHLGLTKGKKGLHTPDFLFVQGVFEEEKLQGVLLSLQEAGVGVLARSSSPYVTQVKEASEVLEGEDVSSLALIVKETLPSQDRLPRFLLLAPQSSFLHEGRRWHEEAKAAGLTTPMLLLFSFEGSEEDSVIHTAAYTGALLLDGQFDGICLATPGSLQNRVSLGFSLLQGARRRIVKTEFISCPGCGRTLFDLQSVSKRIREQTAHLPGVRIAIMGCIVNGPGEMADADFGYVGSRPGKVDLYIGKECVEKNIDFADADARLINLIKQQGKWLEPSLEPM